MFIPDFWLGGFTLLALEFIAVFVYAIISNAIKHHTNNKCRKLENKLKCMRRKLEEKE